MGLRDLSFVKLHGEIVGTLRNDVAWMVVEIECRKHIQNSVFGVHIYSIYERSVVSCEFVYHRLLSATPRCDHLCVVNSTKVVHTNSTKVVHMNSTKVVHMKSTKVVHMNSVHGKVVTHSGVATNSTCVSRAPRSRLNSRSSSDSWSGKRRLELLLLLLLFYTPSGPKYLQQFFWFFLCDPRRTRRFCTRVGLAILEYHPIDEYKLQIA